jgi:methylated-DNA-[protein]-cysteine S-methyltransferase
MLAGMVNRELNRKAPTQFRSGLECSLQVFPRYGYVTHEGAAFMATLGSRPVCRASQAEHIEIQEQVMEYLYKTVDSPVGKLTLVAKGEELTAILWENERPGRVRLGSMREAVDDSTLDEVERQLGEYFTGERSQFDVPLCFVGTDFQKKVWRALLDIPYGETRTYSEIAVEIGNAKAVRAVGAANGRNPISIIAPCHRVIGASGALTGFAGGLPAKETLLSLEGIRWDTGPRRKSATSEERDSSPG